MRQSPRYKSLESADSEQASSHNPTPARFYSISYSRYFPTLIMKQEVDLEQKLQHLIVCSLDHSVLYGAVISHPGEQGEKANPVAFDTVSPKPSQEDPGCPDGGLQAWLVVLGVRLPMQISLWTITDNVLGFLCYLRNVSSLRYTVYLSSLIQGTLLADLALRFPGGLVDPTWCSGFKLQVLISLRHTQ